MPDHLEYDGQTLTWKPGGHRYRATSGLVEEAILPGGIRSLTDHRIPSQQCVRDRGPIPEGNYYLQARLDPQKYARDDGTNRCNLRAAGPIQHIPRGGDPALGPRGMRAGRCEPFWANWGWRRVQLQPADARTARACSPARGGFYLHDSTKGYTHGCIEVEGAFFDRLIRFARTGRQSRMLLKVAYRTPTTDGGTRVSASRQGP
jgi:hypothetical protein